ncbi:MAG: BolA family transcriptional regulator [Proteobacteria bacterium]|nr:MAG: BolA family transcriptional regulator [Pseudomonadota bacterium]
MQSIQNQLESRLEAHFSPVFSEIVNESHMHNVPPGSESHFKVTLVSDKFDGLRQVKRHQEVYGLVADLMSGPIHALALHTMTAAEWSAKGAVPDSPNCLGGGR